MIRTLLLVTCITVTLARAETYYIAPAGMVPWYAVAMRAAVQECIGMGAGVVVAFQ